VSGGLIDLAGRTVLVTGGSRGLGRAVALLLARAGARVGITYRTRASAAERVASEMREQGAPEVWAGSLDLTSDGDAARALEEMAGALGDGLDILVVNAGIWPPEEASLGEMLPQQWNSTIDVNLNGTFRVLQAAIPRLRDGSRVVIISSTAAQRGEAFHADYAASKGAVQSLAKSLAVELGPRGITVNAVAPGWIDTEMVASALDEATRARALGEIPLRRIATAEDIAGPVLFLCSDLARHVTGEVLNVNGGSVRCG
jgi:3-oxoacyl-[acyl-carrier protein] reductase